MRPGWLTATLIQLYEVSDHITIFIMLIGIEHSSFFDPLGFHAIFNSFAPA